ncbi:MAG TPA: hypothetical protein VHY48_06435 [Acidobacteriaceae bacterium]|jgi:hypothetical protein|nr:hypothetical protein [Acidobacteriaceae bacterium]
MICLHRSCILAAALFAAVSARTAPAQTHPKARAASPCALLTVAQINAVAGTQVQPGQPGHSGTVDCTWNDSKGQNRVYLALEDATDFHSFRLQMQATGNLLPISGVGEDAFFVSSAAGSSAALYTLKDKHLLLLTVDGPGFTKGQNEAAEKALATSALTRL